MLLFYAFCLQEGELRFAEFYQTDENREHYSGETAHMHIGDSDDSSVRTAGGFSIREWREYIRDKYRIMPPALGNAFVGLTRNFFYLTGGLSFAECDEQTEPRESISGNSIEALSLTKKLSSILGEMGITSISRLARCYQAGILLRLQGISFRQLRKIEDKLFELGAVSATVIQTSGGGKLMPADLYEIVPPKPEDYE
jgi:hypothetical protein